MSKFEWFRVAVVFGGFGLGAAGFALAFAIIREQVEDVVRCFKYGWR